MNEPFFQDPPRPPENSWVSDPFLRGYLRRHLPPDVLRAAEPVLGETGRLAGGPLYDRLASDPGAEPSLTSFDPWGKRVDRIELTPLWVEAARLAAELGLVALPYERTYGPASRLVQFALVYLFDPSTAVYTCPLAMTDGAAKTLLRSGNAGLAARALPRLTSRDPSFAWTSGQWMTEKTGGSDVATTRTLARKEGEEWRLWGTKWFTSATTSEMALTLARPEGNPPGGAGLALFYLETRDGSGAPNGILINRLKDKLGTRMVPTAEIELMGTRAVPVRGLTDGVKNISTMLNVTRTWNAVSAAAGMRRAIDLARDYATRRIAFGAPLSEKPLHADTLADLEATFAAAFLLAFRTVELTGRDECGVATDDERSLLRILTPLAKLTTGRQAVSVASEALESFGGAGYVEDTGLPRLLRDAQVLPIWEGTTNVLSLDLLRALSKSGGLGPVERERDRCLAGAGGALAAAGRPAEAALARAAAWLARHSPDPAAIEAGARRFARTVGAALQLLLLVDEARHAGDGSPFRDAAVRFARFRIDRILDDVPAGEAARLLVRSDG